MRLTEKQKRHVRKQLEGHDREPGERKIFLDEESDESINLFIEEGVFGSDIMGAAIHLARFLYNNPELYAEKDVADIGCGPGTQGIITSRYGANSVVFSDINPKAVENTRKNVKEHNLEDTKVFESDLFENLPKNKAYDVVIFNHPFFPGDPESFEDDPIEDEMLRRSMLGGTKLIKRFFKNVSDFIKEDGIIIMPYFHLAGRKNDPMTHASKDKFKIIRKHEVESEEGLQLGEVSIYVIAEK